jgi:hypothetical protein
VVLGFVFSVNQGSEFLRFSALIAGIAALALGVCSTVGDEKRI